MAHKTCRRIGGPARRALYWDVESIRCEKGRHEQPLHRHPRQGRRTRLLHHRSRQRPGRRRRTVRSAIHPAAFPRPDLRPGEAALRTARGKHLQGLRSRPGRRNGRRSDGPGLWPELRRRRNLPHRLFGQRHARARAVARPHERVQGHGAAVPAPVFQRKRPEAPRRRRHR